MEQTLGQSLSLISQHLIYLVVAPDNPSRMEVTDTDKGLVSLRWAKPLSDGGDRIQVCLSMSPCLYHSSQTITDSAYRLTLLKTNSILTD